MTAAPLAALLALLAGNAPDGGLAAPAVAPAPAAAPAPGSRRVLDRIVAIVDRQPLTLSQLELEARVAFINQGATEAATAALTEEDLANALEWAIGQRLAFAEADRLQVFGVSEAEVAKALKAFEARFGGEQAYQAFLASQETTPAEVAVLLRREMRVSRFLDSKVKLSARVTEEDLRRFFDAHGAELGGEPFERVRDTIRARLTRERYQSLAKNLLEQLRAKADVRTVAPFAARSPSPAPDAGSAPP